MADSDVRLPMIDSPAHTRLNGALANAVARGQFVPCAGPWDGDSPWLSDDPDERAWAAERCTGCPAISECRQAGQLEAWGVWGAVDRTTRAASGRSRSCADPGQAAPSCTAQVAAGQPTVTHPPSRARR